MHVPSSSPTLPVSSHLPPPPPPPPSLSTPSQQAVSVSRTPGHTKHFQTIYLSDSIILCDCPGLVLPAVAEKELQVMPHLIMLPLAHNPPNHNAMNVCHCSSELTVGDPIVPHSTHSGAVRDLPHIPSQGTIHCGGLPGAACPTSVPPALGAPKSRATPTS